MSHCVIFNWGVYKPDAFYFDFSESPMAMCLIFYESISRQKNSFNISNSSLTNITSLEAIKAEHTLYIIILRLSNE